MLLLDMEEVPVMVTFGDFVTSQNSFRLFYQILSLKRPSGSTWINSGGKA
jgi:hypothetical protein